MTIKHFFTCFLCISGSDLRISLSKHSGVRSPAACLTSHFMHCRAAVSWESLESNASKTKVAQMFLKHYPPQEKSLIIVNVSKTCSISWWTWFLIKLVFISENLHVFWDFCPCKRFSVHSFHLPPPFFVSPRLSLCLSQLPGSLILNPVEIGQAEWASFDQALISRLLTVSAHPDPKEPWNPRGELQTAVHPLTLLESKGKRRLQCSRLNCQLYRLLHKSPFF